MSRLATSLLLVAGIALGASLAFLLGEVRSPAGPANAVLVTPARAQGSLAANPTGATQLAATYAEVLSGDARLARAIGRTIGASPETVGQSLTVRAQPDGAVLTVGYAAEDAATARRALGAALQWLRQPTNPIEGIDPSTISVVSGPQADGASDLGAQARMTLLIAAPSSTGGDALAANRLAANYVGLISEDSQVIDFAAARAGMTSGELRSQLRVTNDFNTSLVRVTVQGSDYAQSRRAVLGIVRAVAGPRPITDKVAPSTLEVTRLPGADAGDSGGVGTAPIVGGLLGLLVAAAMAWAIGRRNPRVRDAATVRELFGVPVLDLEQWTPQVGRSLTSRWASAGATDVVLLSTSGATDAVSEALAQALDGLGHGRMDVSFRSHAELWEAKLGWDGRPAFGVLVVAAGDRGRPLIERIARFVAQGGSVDWGIVIGSAARHEELVAELHGGPEPVASVPAS